MTDVRLALHRQTADVETRLALLKGHEVTDFAGRSVIEPERHRASLGTSEPACPHRQSGCRVTEVTDVTYRREHASRRLGLCLLLALSGVGACSTADEPDGSAVAVAGTSSERQITLTRWDSGRQWRRGAQAGTAVREGRLSFDRPVAATTAGGRSYDVARWTSPWVEPGYAFTELIASWSARTPKDSWIEVQVRGRGGSGGRTSWDVLGRWTSGDRHLQRATVSGQSDDGTSVAVDTWRTSGLPGYQLRISSPGGPGRRTDRAWTWPPR